MLALINELILKIADPLLNWLLYLHSDLALILVGVGTGALLTFARPLTTNQDLLGRCARDKRRLKQLIKEAKTRKDKAAIRRYRASKGMIAIMAAKSEGLPLLVAILPIALLGTWCFQRLEFHAPQAGETVPVHAYFPISAAGGVVHLVPQEDVTLVPQEDVTAAESWVKQIVAVADPPKGPPHALATWHLKAKVNRRPYSLEIRYKGGTYTKQLLVGQKTYTPAVEFYGDDEQIICAEIQQRQVKLFGFVPGIPLTPPYFLAPWLVAYFPIAIASVSLTKRLLRIY